MTRVYLEDEWKTYIQVDMLREAVEIYFKETNTKSVEWGIGTIIGTQGSQFRTRLKGLWLAKHEELPKRIIVHYRELDESTLVRIRLEEALGIGWLDGRSKEKYMESFRSWIIGFRELTPLTAPKGKQESPRSFYVKEIIREIVFIICPFCKHKNEQQNSVCKKCGGAL